MKNPKKRLDIRGYPNTENLRKLIRQCMDNKRMDPPDVSLKVNEMFKKASMADTTVTRILAGETERVFESTLKRLGTAIMDDPKVFIDFSDRTSIPERFSKLIKKDSKTVRSVGAMDSPNTIKDEAVDQLFPKVIIGDKAAWEWSLSYANQKKIWRDIVRFYRDRNFNYIFDYPSKDGERISVPLYVRPEWRNLTSDDWDPSTDPSIQEYYDFHESQEKFCEMYPKFRKIPKERFWDGDIFRLVDLGLTDSGLKPKFIGGKFFGSVKSHYYLEHEVVTTMFQSPDNTDYLFPLRGKIAGSEENILNFSKNNYSRIGVSNLLLFKQKDGRYLPIIYARAEQSLAEGFDTVSSGIYDIVTVPSMDSDVKHKLFVEIFEELYGREEFERRTDAAKVERLYSADEILKLQRLIEVGDATYDLTGFCIDLIRVTPELTSVLVVRDPGYLEEFRARFKLRKKSEHKKISDWPLPMEIRDLDTFLAHDMLTDPDKKPPSFGFDPYRWTLPGGFTFYQGVKRAVEGNLLE